MSARASLFPPLPRQRRRELLLILVGYLPNEFWHVLGLVLVRGLNEDSEIVVVRSRAVATAIIAGVIAKLIIFSTGALATIPLPVRVSATLFGFLVFLALKRSAFAGVLAGVVALVVAGIFSGVRARDVNGWPNKNWIQAHYAVPGKAEMPRAQ